MTRGLVGPPSQTGDRLETAGNWGFQLSAEPHIPERFAHALDEHLVFNLCGGFGWPLVLGIFGRPGDGKSFQIRTHLERRGVLPVTINAADLESDRAGTPGKLVLSVYQDAGHRIEEGCPAAVLVDDFDTTVGEWENSTTTVNHQQVLAQLMHLADSPTEAAGKKLRRVPVFITGNDLSKVYPPLRRPGRMRAFPWLPNQSDREAIVAGILASVLPASEIPGLLATVPDAPIAFFSDLLSEILARSSDAEVRRLAQDLPSLARAGTRGRDALSLHVSKNPLSPNEIGGLAAEIWSDRALATQSHLGK